MDSTYQPISTTPVIFCNELSIGFTDNDCQVKFTVQGQPHAPAPHVGMTHTTAKLLAEMLTLILADFEKKSGKDIPFDPTKLDGLRQQMEQAAKPSSE
jgi:hypothetical protein